MPAIKSFFGGLDVQRSLNMSDNRCVNLIPVTNDDGTVRSFINAPGLSIYATNTNGLIASGIYTASNGRCFMVAHTTLYEITTGGVMTSRGTVTSATVSRMTDNGLELILVNGTDGWIFTFSTNSLRQIKVSSGTCTISNATPAVITKAAHGLITGDRFTLSTAGALPTGLLTSTTYYVIATGLTDDAFQLSLTEGGTAIATSSAGSGTHTLTTLGYGFPNGCKTVTYINGRFVACEHDTQNFFCSEVLDGGYWDALNVQTADANPDKIKCEIASHNELIVFCEMSGEVYYDSGTIPSPFTRNSSGIFEVGCVAPYSVAKIDNSVMWLGKSSTGQGLVYRLNGYTPMRISSYAIEQEIQKLSVIDDALAFTYQQDGHHFYVLTFPTGNKTFVFDANTGLWHERIGFALGIESRWEAQEYAFFDGKHLVCDYLDGHIYEIDMATYTNGSRVRKWIRSFKSPSVDNKRLIHKKLTLDIESGVGLSGSTDNELMMRYSDDGGHTWSNYSTRSMGLVGEYSKRVFWNRLGLTKCKPRLYEISGTSPVKTVLVNAYLE